MIGTSDRSRSIGPSSSGRRAGATSGCADEHARSVGSGARGGGRRRRPRATGLGGWNAEPSAARTRSPLAVRTRLEPGAAFFGDPVVAYRSRSSRPCESSAGERPRRAELRPLRPSRRRPWSTARRPGQETDRLQLHDPVCERRLPAGRSAAHVRLPAVVVTRPRRRPPADGDRRDAGASSPHGSRTADVRSATPPFLHPRRFRRRATGFPDGAALALTVAAALLGRGRRLPPRGRARRARALAGAPRLRSPRRSWRHSPSCATPPGARTPPIGARRSSCSPRRLPAEGNRDPGRDTAERVAWAEPPPSAERALELADQVEASRWGRRDGDPLRAGAARRRVAPGRCSSAGPARAARRPGPPRRGERRHPRADAQPLLPAQAGGVVVLDLSASITSDTYSRIHESLQSSSPGAGATGSSCSRTSRTRRCRRARRPRQSSRSRATSASRRRRRRAAADVPRQSVERPRSRAAPRSRPGSTSPGSIERATGSAPRRRPDQRPRRRSERLPALNRVLSEFQVEHIAAPRDRPQRRPERPGALRSLIGKASSIVPAGLSSAQSAAVALRDRLPGLARRARGRSRAAARVAELMAARLDWAPGERGGAL